MVKGILKRKRDGEDGGSRKKLRVGWDEDVMVREFVVEKRMKPTVIKERSFDIHEKTAKLLEVIFDSSEKPVRRMQYLKKFKMIVDRHHRVKALQDGVPFEEMDISEYEDLLLKRVKEESKSSDSDMSVPAKGTSEGKVVVSQATEQPSEVVSQATEQPSETKVERIVLSQAEAVRFLHPPPPTEKVVESQATEQPSEVVVWQATEQPSETKVERIVLSQAEALRFLHPPPPTERVVGSQATQLPSSPLSELANTGVTIGAGCKLNYRRAEAITVVISSDTVQSDPDDGRDWSLPQALAVEKILQILYLIRRAEGTVCRRRLSDTDVIPDDG